MNNDIKKVIANIPTWVLVLTFFFASPLAIMGFIARAICKDMIKDDDQVTELRRRVQVAEEDARRLREQRAAEAHRLHEEKEGILSLKKGKLMTAIGFGGLGLFGFGTVMEVLDMISSIRYGYFYPEDLLFPLAFAAAFAVLANFGQKSMQKARRLRRLVNYVGNSRCVQIDQLADMMDCGRVPLKKDLRYLLDHDFFRGAFIDDKTNTFRWADAGENLEQVTKKKKAAPEKTAEGDYAQVLQIRQVRQKIQDPEVAEKLAELEKRTQAIYDYLTLHPEKREKARMFENHYFPTTVKILEAYANFEKSGVRGENVAAAMAEVEQVLDTLIQCFEKQLDCLYADEAMNITAEVKVMEDLLARDGLAQTLTLQI